MTKTNLVNSLELEVKRIRVSKSKNSTIPKQTIELMKKYQQKLNSYE